MTIDILIVYNMLLTGFDAPRLKRLYFGRKLKDHNLLQAITRVNRPYKDNKYGYIIDFANIKSNFEQTNEAYLKELNRFNDPNEVGAGNTTDTFTQVIEDKDALVQQMREVRQVLFDYTTDNVEEFSSEISTIEDKQILLELKKAYPHITLEAAIPCPTQSDKWSAPQRERYRAILAQCDVETMVQQEYTSGCMQRRNRYMVDHAALLIAVNDGEPGGTRNTILYAMRQGLNIADIPI